MIEKNDEFLKKFQSLLISKYTLLSESLSTVELGDLVERTGKLLKNTEWVDDIVVDLSTMESNNMFVNNFSSGANFATNIKSLHEFDLLYGSIRPYFRKAGFSVLAKYVAGSVYSFNTKRKDDYLWILACICSDSFHLFTDSNSQGTKMPIINWDTFVSYKVPYDKEVINSFNNEFKKLFDLAVIKMKENKKLEIIKQKLLEKYF